MMSLHTAMLVGLLAPLVVSLLTPFLAVRHVSVSYTHLTLPTKA